MYFGRVLIILKRDPECLKLPRVLPGEPLLNPLEEMHTSSQVEQSCSEQGTDAEITFHHPRQPQPVLSMFMPYTEGPKMDWTVNNGLYHGFLKWHLKCENILECKLAALPECQQCKKVIAWSGDFGMDQYLSWGLPTDQLTLDTIWEIFEEFCKPHSNKVHARFDLLTCFRQGSRSVDEWYNAVQAQVNQQNTPQKLQRSFTGTFSGFS